MSTRIILGGKGGRCVRLTTSPPLRAEYHGILEPKPPGTLWTTPGLLRNCFTFTVMQYIYEGYKLYLCFDAVQLWDILIIFIFQYSIIMLIQHFTVTVITYIVPMNYGCLLHCSERSVYCSELFECVEWLIVIAVQHIVGDNNVVRLDTGNCKLFSLKILFSCWWKLTGLFDCLIDPFFLKILK